MNQFSFDGCSASGIARGISQRFQLNAECLAVEAACASSLAALHYAVKALQSGRIEMAVVAVWSLRPTRGIWCCVVLK
ncbi:beta-ketoacyl synthase N-terminal-like domain-containing protein [Vibrio sp. PP-XX7]